MPARFPNPPANVIDFADPALTQIRKTSLGAMPAPKTVTTDVLHRHGPDSFDGETLDTLNPGDTLVITGEGSYNSYGIDLRMWGTDDKVPGVTYQGFSGYNYDNSYHEAHRTLTVHFAPTMAPGTHMILQTSQFGTSVGEILEITLGGPKPTEHLIDSAWLGSTMLWPKPPLVAAQAGMRHWQATDTVWYGTNNQRISVNIWMPAVAQMPALPGNAQYAWTDADRSQEMMIVRFVATKRGQNFVTTDTLLHDATVKPDGTATFNFVPQPAGFENAQALKMELSGLNRATFIPQAGTQVAISTTYPGSGSSWVRLNKTAFNFRRMA